MPQLISTQLDVTRPLQWFGEGLLTTTSNFGAKTNPVYTNMGLNPVWDYKFMPEGEDINKVGSPVRSSKQKVFETALINFRTYINDTNGYPFLKWLMNEGNGATVGTVDESIELGFSYKVNATEYFCRARGVMP